MGRHSPLRDFSVVRQINAFIKLYAHNFRNMK